MSALSASGSASRSLPSTLAELFTNTRAGFRQRSGASSRSGRRVTANPFGNAFVPANRVAMVSA